MLRTITEIFDAFRSTNAAGDDTRTVELAAAILMVEVGVADHDFSSDEEAAIRRILTGELGMTGEQAVEVMASASREVEQAVGIQSFTRRLNEQWPEAQKVQLVRQLWHIAAADGRIDPHEEHRIRRIADLLYVPHVKFVRARHDAERSARKSARDTSG